MKVAIISPYDLGTSGGVQAQVLGITAGLEARGHDVVAIGPAGHISRIPSNGSVAPISLDPRDWQRIRRQLTTCDVLHIHEPLMPLVSWSALTTRMPSVATFHADASKAVRRLYSVVARPVKRLLADAVVTAVSPVASSAISAFAEARIIPNGIRVPKEQPQKGAQSLVVLGRDDPRKGLDVLLRAWPAVFRVHPHARLSVVGRVERPAMDGVTFTGFVNEAEKERILGTSRIMVAPQISGESFGITLAEGMAAGCLVVASNLPAFRFVLNGHGILFDAGDAEQLAKALIQLLEVGTAPGLSDGEIRASAGRFSWDLVLDAYLNTYETALKKSL